MYIKRYGSIFLFLLLIMILIGCTSGTNNSNQEKENSSETNDAHSNQEKQNTSEENKNNTGGELNFAYHVQPSTLDPHMTANNATTDISSHIFESLLTLNSSLEVQPMLAENYEISENGKMITFNLRKGISFHNGDEMTAKDVISSMERWQSLSSQALSHLEGTTYEALDDYTVIAHIENPTILDLYIFADPSQSAVIMPEEIVRNASSDGVEEIIGTGPYKLVEWQSDHYVHLEKFNDYQSREEPSDGLSGGKNANIQEIYYHLVIDPSTRIAGLQSGEYDIISSVSPDNAVSLSKDDNFQVITDFNLMTPINLNKKSGVFTNQKARQAVNAAINYEDLMKAAYVDEQFYELDHALANENQTGWYSNVGSDVYNTYDPDLAKQLLTESGYNGEEVVIITSREYPNYYNMSIVVQEQLEQIGMNVRIDVTDWATVGQNREDPEKWDMFFNQFTARPIPILYHFMGTEWFGWTDSPEIEEISDKILYADSLEEAQSYTDELHQVFWDYLPILKPGNSSAITSVSKNVEGFQYVSYPILWNVSINK